MLYHIENPQFLWLLIPLAGFTLLMIQKAYRYPTSRSWRRIVTVTLAFGAAILALSRPQLGTQETNRSQGSSNLFIAIDVSQSMLAEDLSPSRLGFAISASQKLLRELASTRFALFPFAGNGFMQVPLTTDHHVIEEFLPTLSPSITSDQETDLTNSLQTLLLSIQKMEANALQRGEEFPPTSVILFSDGESHHEIEQQTLEGFRTKKIPIYTVGTGTLTGAPIPKELSYGTAQYYLKDNQGKTVITKLNPEPLHSISSLTGGQYLTADLPSVIALAKKVSRSAKVSRAQTKLVVKREYYPLLFLLAFILFLFDFSLGRWQYAIRGFVFIALLTTSARASSIEDEKDPNRRAILNYNLGVELLDQKQLEKAAQYFYEASQLTNDFSLKKKALYNLGNATLLSAKPKEALETYQQAFDIQTPDDNKFESESNARISENMELAAKLQAMMQSQPQSGDGSEGNENPQDPNGPKNNYENQAFSAERKKRIYDLLASEEQQTRRRLSQTNNKSQNRIGHPW